LPITWSYGPWSFLSITKKFVWDSKPSFFACHHISQLLMVIVFFRFSWSIISWLVFQRSDTVQTICIGSQPAYIGAPNHTKSCSCRHFFKASPIPAGKPSRNRPKQPSPNNLAPTFGQQLASTPKFPARAPEHPHQRFQTILEKMAARTLRIGK
jgi:hypothetical protein